MEAVLDIQSSLYDYMMDPAGLRFDTLVIMSEKGYDEERAERIALQNFNQTN